MTILGGKVHTHVRYRRGQAGFTLIELLIVVAILAILAAILIPNFLRARASSQLATCQLDLRNIAAALELFYGQNQTYPLAVSWQNDLVTGGFYSEKLKTPVKRSVMSFNTHITLIELDFLRRPRKKLLEELDAVS